MAGRPLQYARFAAVMGVLHPAMLAAGSQGRQARGFIVEQQAGDDGLLHIAVQLVVSDSFERQPPQ